MPTDSNARLMMVKKTFKVDCVLLLSLVSLLLPSFLVMKDDSSWIQTVVSLTSHFIWFSRFFITWHETRIHIWRRIFPPPNLYLFSVSFDCPFLFSFLFSHFIHRTRRTAAEEKAERIELNHTINRSFVFFDVGDFYCYSIAFVLCIFLFSLSLLM